MEKVIDTLTAESVALLREMVAIPSPSFGEEDVCGHVSGFLQRADIRHSKLKNNIIAMHPDCSPGRKTLMLCSHLDTVSPSDDYSFDPYKPDYKELDNRREWLCSIGAASSSDIVAGLGSNDDGASAVSMMAAFRHFHGKRLPFNLMLVLSSEEERSGKDGMEAVWKAFEDGSMGMSSPDWAIVGEPTGMRAAIAERGLLVIDGLAEGASGHAARDEGVNALYIALDDIRRLRDFRFGKESPLMGKVRLTVTQINAGTVHNVIPDKCTYTIDIRPTEMYNNPEIMELLGNELKSSLRARNLKNKSSATPSGHILVKWAESAHVGKVVSPTTSDWVKIDFPAMKIGPGKSERSHKADEFITVEELEKGIETYTDIIDYINDREK